MKFLNLVRFAPVNSRVTTTLATLLAVSALTACSPTVDKKAVAPDASKPLQIGWVTSWASAGQLMQSLNHTNITDLYGMPMVLHGYPTSPELNEAALHGDIDCVSNALVPTVSLLSASEDWVVVGRLVDSPLSVVARKGAKIESVRGLKGKSIGVLFTSGAHPYVLELLAKNDLQIGEGADKVKLVNLKPGEQASAMQKGSVDAVAAWEPQIGILLSKDLGKVITQSAIWELLLCANQLPTALQIESSNCLNRIFKPIITPPPMPKKPTNGIRRLPKSMPKFCLS